MQVGGQRDATEMRCDVRHEFHRMAKLSCDLALVQVIDQGIGQQIVAQLVLVVLF